MGVSKITSSHKNHYGNDTEAFCIKAILVYILYLCYIYKYMYTYNIHYIYIYIHICNTSLSLSLSLYIYIYIYIYMYVYRYILDFYYTDKASVNKGKYLQKLCQKM